MKHSKEIIVFADGSSLGNPGPGGWGVVVVYQDNKLKVKSEKLKVTELGGGNKHTTNNRMELTAAIEALEFSSKLKTQNVKLLIYTDSSYTINGITKWIKRWEKTDWIGTNKKEILNQDLWKKLSKLTKGKNILWKHVRGHVGIAGNERADFLATMNAREQNWKKGKFFTGPLSKYPFDILNTKPAKKFLRKSASSRRKSAAKAHSYLSLVDGKLIRHQTWPECEKRIKGVSGAKFKKAVSAEDEKEIMRGWGIKG
ncbi:MAG: viroplasmin family protein [Patescibacteria group bacterium]